jgi:hypothetical protein
MAVRSVQIELSNHSGFPLNLSRVEKCWGKWNSPPPHTIPNNSTAVITAESTGTAAGTTGLFEYQFQPRTGLAPERGFGDPPRPWPPYRVVAFFDNPFFSGLFGRRTGLNVGLTRTDNYLVACNHGITSKSTTETAYDNIPMDFALDRASDTQTGGGAAFSEVAFHALSAAAGGWGVSIVGTQRLIEHPVFHLTLHPTTDPAPQTIPDFEPYRVTRLRPSADVSFDFWPATWKAVAPDGRAIQVDITGQPNSEFKASVRDNVLPEVFNGTGEGLRPQMRLVDDYGADAWNPVLLFPARPIMNVPRAPQRQAPMRQPGGPADRNVAALLNRAHGRAASPLLQLPLVDTLIIDEHCYVQSYGEFEGGVQVGKMLRYVRSSGMYAPVCDVMLSNRLNIR